MISTHQERDIAAVVVAFQPDLHLLSALLSALRLQVHWIILVDNASTVDVRSVLSGQDVELLRLEENMGLAAAQNIGIQHAMILGAEFVYLSDQDSLPAAGMIALLKNAYRQTTITGSVAVAAVGALSVDARTGMRSFFMRERWGWLWRYHPKEGDNAVIETGFLIASGTLIPTSVIQTIGGMRSEYFIDHVDTEWCRRARVDGYRLLGVPNAFLRHRLGDAVKKVWFFGWRQVMSHAPLRDYYMFRNTLLMLRDVPMKWRERGYFFWRLLQYAGYFLVFGEQRKQRACLMSRGLWHGFRGKSGRLDLTSMTLTPIPITELDPR